MQLFFFISCSSEKVPPKFHMTWSTTLTTVLFTVGALALFRFEGLYDEAADDVPIFLDDLQCTGEELRLEDCVVDFSTEDCLHFLQDVGVECQPLVE